MLRETLNKILLLVVLSFFVLPLSAQNEAYNAYTPYSMFGIGEISKQGTSYNKTMGGEGLATSDKRNINILNPAAVTAREEKSFMADFGLAQGNRYYAQHDMRSSNNTFNVYDFVISFPVYKSLAMYAGVTPYSDVGYDVTSKLTDPSIIASTGVITNSVKGYGGMTNLFVGAGVDVLKGLSVGVEGQYYFGNIHKTNKFTMTNSSYRSISSGFNLDLSAVTAKFGVQYETALSQNLSAVFGATYRQGTSLKGNVERYEIQSISSLNDSTPAPRSYIDTL